MALIRDSKLRELLMDGRIDAFNEEIGDKDVDLQNLDLKGVDLRGANLKSADLRGAYLKNADLRGMDLSAANLRGASLQNARVSGVLLPKGLSPAEVEMSLKYGTRLRVDGE